MITAAEVTLSYMDVGWVFLPALLILMMIAKFFIVVSFFMHLKFDNRLFSFLFYMGLGLAVFVYAVGPGDVPLLRLLTAGFRDRARRRGRLEGCSRSPSWTRSGSRPTSTSGCSSPP